ncbi:MAG TPA: fumarylacetoacetate hydrolase family protein [Thermodesulfobacteriota bacterium]|nr:fumarylacetoacetate hydrolase family protein [Thermodesulfobacteriota bacterium]
MRLVRFSVDNKDFSGILDNERVFAAEGVDVLGFGFAYEAFRIKKGLASWDAKKVKFLPPVLPSKVVAIGLNYKAHAAEFSKPLPEEPMMFLKPSTSVIGPNDEIVYPSHMSKRVDYEGELAIVVGRNAVKVSKENAKKHILGYTCFNDVTARDLQGKDIQYTRAKGFDTFAPIGPWIETDIDPLDARVESYLNGEKKQDSSTKDMIFDVYQLLSFVSNVMTLLPGDVIATGTPSGVGPMKPGDTVEVRIEGIGSLVNTVKGQG